MNFYEIENIILIRETSGVEQQIYIKQKMLILVAKIYKKICKTY